MGLDNSEAVRVPGGKKRAHILMIGLEEQGHYTVFLHLLYLLSPFDNITVTFCTSERRVKHLEELLRAGEFKNLDLRLVLLSHDVSQTADIPGGLPPIWGFVKAMKVQFEAYRKKLVAETNPEAKPTCLVSDALLPWSEELAEELQVPRYLLFTTAGWAVYTVLKDRVEGSEQTGPEDIVKIPGQFSAPANEEPSIIYPLVNLRNVAGMLVNTYEELEGEELLEAIQTYLPHMTTKPGSKVARFLPIGPLVHNPSYSLSLKDSGHQSKAFQWLAKKPASSVLYIAFGTMANIPAPLIFELARGLELSGVPFLWVVRHSNPSTDLSNLLPPGFMDCVKAQGFLETEWAPQLQILRHPSTGGFISHCGWNSSIETISSGVPVLTWPVHGDQHLNARFLVEKLKVGLPVRKHESPSPIVPGEHVSAVIKSLMIDDKGRELRQNSARLKDLALRATQDGGSSHRNLHQFVNEILTHYPECTCTTNSGCRCRMLDSMFGSTPVTANSV